MKVLVAMSGGVDSSVAASVLADDGHDVVGVTMRLWGGPSDTGCCSASEVSDARRAAAQLGVDHHVFDYSEEFERFVVDPYVADHAVGRTPKRCCNRSLLVVYSSGSLCPASHSAAPKAARVAS